jgi:hypothetical protein
MNDWREEERKRTRAMIEGDADAYTSVRGVRRWRSNDAAVPPSVYKEAGLDCPSVQVAAHEAETQAWLAEYRKNMANYVPSAEEAFEMRAAFGPDVEVVNVITGRTHRTSK